jgi:hypothetical protein
MSYGERKNTFLSPQYLIPDLLFIFMYGVRISAEMKFHNFCTKGSSGFWTLFDFDHNRFGKLNKVKNMFI